VPITHTDEKNDSAMLDGAGQDSSRLGGATHESAEILHAILRNVRFPLTKRQSSTTKHFRLGPDVPEPEHATEPGAPPTAVSDHLTSLYGDGPWLSHTPEKEFYLRGRHSKVLVVTEGAAMVATLVSPPKTSGNRHFTKCGRPVYLLKMAVAPASQRQGIGRRCLEEAERIARARPADAFRLGA
jgi:hypothetical protein